MIPQKMRSETEITLTGIDLYEMHDVQVDIKQGNNFERSYTPKIVGRNTLVITIPVADAAELTSTPVFVQILYTDKNNIPHASKQKRVPVQAIQRSGTYGK